MTSRPSPIAFQFKEQQALSDNRYKLYSSDGGAKYGLFDIVSDPHEDRDISNEQPEIAATMRGRMQAWLDSCATDAKGADDAD